MTLKSLEDTKLENCAPRNNNPGQRSSQLFAAEASNTTLNLVEQKYAVI